MDGDLCPHCGSEDYGPVNEGHEHACLTCGYDTENGTLGVCPGGLHPRDGALCCNPCRDRVPRDLPGWPRWRSYRRTAQANARRGFPYAGRMVDAVDDAVVAWLREHRLSAPDGRLVP